MTGRWQIIVCDRGFVLAGIVRPGPSPLVIVIDRCQCIRRWGTTAGLGQLALTGPTENTVLDPEGSGVEQSLIHVFRRINIRKKAIPAWEASAPDVGDDDEYGDEYGDE